MGLGHCSVLNQDGTWILYCHSRINNGYGGEAGLWMQCHQLLWSEEGWPLMVAAFYDGEQVQQVSPGAMVGTFQRIDLSKNDADLTRTATEMTFSPDGTFYQPGRFRPLGLHRRKPGLLLLRFRPHRPVASPPWMDQETAGAAM